MCVRFPSHTSGSNSFFSFCFCAVILTPRLVGDDDNEDIVDEDDAASLVSLRV